MIHHGETEIAPIFRTDSSVLIQKELSLMPMGRAAVRPSTAFNSYVNNQRNKNKASTNSTFVLKSVDFQQATHYV